MNILRSFLPILFIMLAVVSATPEPHPYCPGGDVYAHARLADEHAYRLEGTYASACTMFVKLGCVFPDNHGTPRTLLKFHSAMPVVKDDSGRWIKTPGERPGMHQPGNSVMLRYYPPALQQYILKHKCFDTTKFKCRLSGSRLIEMGVPQCAPN